MKRGTDESIKVKWTNGQMNKGSINESTIQPEINPVMTK